MARAVSISRESRKGVLVCFAWVCLVWVVRARASPDPWTSSHVPIGSRPNCLRGGVQGKSEHLFVADPCLEILQTRKADQHHHGLGALVWIEPLNPVFLSPSLSLFARGCAAQKVVGLLNLSVAVGPNVSKKNTISVVYGLARDGCHHAELRLSAGGKDPNSHGLHPLFSLLPPVSPPSDLRSLSVG